MNTQDEAGLTSSESPQFRPRIAISSGDFNGVGPEVVIKCLSDTRLMRFLEPVIVGPVDALNYHAEHLGFDEVRFRSVESVDSAEADVIPVLDISNGQRCDVQFGVTDPVAGNIAMRAVDRAVELCLSGEVDAMVTAPISKEAISLAGFDSPGHTEFVARKCATESFSMMMVADRMRIGLVTGHTSIWNVPKLITEEVILEKLRIISSCLIRDFGVSRPRIAVLALNPHAGESGMMGKEEAEIIIPALDKARERGDLVFGPFPADGFFGTSGFRNFDAVLAMYHDQGLIPFKTLAFDSGVNYTAGLPIVRTSPDHGTAFDIAGHGVARPTSMRSAIFLAVDIARRRKSALEA